MIICYSYDQDQEKPCKVIWDITAEIVCMHKAGEPNNGICYRSITELTNPLKIGNDHHYYWHGKWIQTVVTKPIFKYSHFSTFQLKLWTMLMKGLAPSHFQVIPLIPNTRRFYQVLLCKFSSYIILKLNIVSYNKFNVIVYLST